MDAVRKADLAPVAAGSPDPDAALALSRSLETERADDLRGAVRHHDADLLWLATRQPIEADTRRWIRERGLSTVSCEPRPMAVADLLLNSAEGTTAHVVPLMRRSPGFRSAADALSDFGPWASALVAVGCGPDDGTLLARLFDAMDLLDDQFGSALGVQATLAGCAGAVPEALRDLHGHMTINARFADHRGAAVAASDAAGSWFRRVTALGPHGRLDITDDGFTWTDPHGSTVDRGGSSHALTPGELIGLHIARVVRNLDAAEGPPPDAARLLALCDAARLSCRTGGSETPQRLLEMMRRP